MSVCWYELSHGVAKSYGLYSIYVTLGMLNLFILEVDLTSDNCDYPLNAGAWGGAVLNQGVLLTESNQVSM